MRNTCIAFVLLGAVVRAATLDALLPARAEPVYRALDAGFDDRLAMETVLFMSRFWRIAGNPGFNASQDFILEKLKEAGVDARLEPFPNEGHGWEMVRANVALATASGTRPLPDVPRPELMVAINSFPQKRTLRLVDVFTGGARDYRDREVRGAIVMGDVPVARLWKDAVVDRGAAGVLSTHVPAFNRPADTPNVIAWSSIPHDGTRRGFGLAAAPVVAAALRKALAEGPVDLAVEIETRFHDGPNRDLVAEIRGSSRPDERIVVVAHVQEPGANDNASGCGTLLALVRALQRGIAEGRIPPPARTLTFLWVDEIRGSQRWLAQDRERAKKVAYMVSLDMTGEDTAQTGGTFLIEKQADPSAAWDRPSDPHSEWGASEVNAASLRGSLLNDLFLAICQRRARDTGWVVRTNPYEGGSDHTVFAGAGIHSLLAWHFTDRYYHTNLDTPDKVSAGEMKNVGVAVATTAWLLASATREDAAAIERLLERALAARLALEEWNAAELEKLGKTPPPETQWLVVEAWKQWYREAIATARALPVDR